MQSWKRTYSDIPHMLLARLRYDRAFCENVLSFFLADNGFGKHQFQHIVFPGVLGDELITPLHDATCDRLLRVGQCNAVRLYSMLAPRIRQRWFEYNQQALKALRDDRAYHLVSKAGAGDVSWAQFDQQLMPAFIALDTDCRLQPRQTFARIFNTTVTCAQEKALLSGGFIPDYNDAVHAYKKWLCYACDILSLLRNTPTYRTRFLHALALPKPDPRCLVLMRVCRTPRDRLQLARVCRAWRRTLYTHYGLSLYVTPVYHRDDNDDIRWDRETGKKLVDVTRLDSWQRQRQ